MFFFLCKTSDWNTSSFFHFQVRSNFRTAITIPERSWVRFRDILSEFVDKQSSSGGAGEGDGDVERDSKAGGDAAGLN